MCRTLDTDILIALAEENPPAKPRTDLSALPREACLTLFGEAVNAWGGLPNSARSSVERLPDYLDNIDALVYLSTKRHREHADHCLSVGLLSHFLLSVALPGDGRPLITKCKARQTDIRGAMWLAAIAHDLGYPLSHYLHILASASSPTSATAVPHPHILQRLRTLGEEMFGAGYPVGWDLVGPIANQNGANLLHTAWQTATNSLREALPGSKLLERYLGNNYGTGAMESHWQIFDHGVWSAWVLVEFLRKKGVLDDFCGNELARRAIEAMAFHNMDVDDFSGRPRLSFGPSPILFLLRLCDAAQEWNRSILTETGLQDELGKVSLGGVHRPIGRKAIFLGDALTLHMEYGHAKPIIDSKWNYDIAVTIFADKLHTLALPASWSPGPQRVSFQIRSPIYDPGHVKR